MTCNNCNNTSCHEQQEEYEEYIPNKEYPLGGFFKIGSEVFKVVRDNYYTCRMCEFNVLKCCAGKVCSANVRTDGDVIFILYDTLEDNE